jgi:hypothetical protein
MDVFEAKTVLGRGAVTVRQNLYPSGEVVRQIVESGHLTGVSINGQPW